MTEFTPRVGFYVNNKSFIIEIVSITKTGMLNLRTWFYDPYRGAFIVDEKGRRKIESDSSISYPLSRGHNSYVYSYFYFEKAIYLKNLSQYEEKYQVEGETILY